MKDYYNFYIYNNYDINKLNNIFNNYINNSNYINKFYFNIIEI